LLRIADFEEDGQKLLLFFEQRARFNCFLGQHESGDCSPSARGAQLTEMKGWLI
jgi:hypothetical protein